MPIGHSAAWNSRRHQGEWRMPRSPHAYQLRVYTCRHAGSVFHLRVISAQSIRSENRILRATGILHQPQTDAHANPIAIQLDSFGALLLTKCTALQAGDELSRFAKESRPIRRFACRATRNGLAAASILSADVSHGLTRYIGSPGLPSEPQCGIELQPTKWPDFGYRRLSRIGRSNLIRTSCTGSRAARCLPR